MIFVMYPYIMGIIQEIVILIQIIKVKIIDIPLIPYFCTPIQNN